MLKYKFVRGQIYNTDKTKLQTIANKLPKIYAKIVGNIQKQFGCHWFCQSKR